MYQKLVFIANDWPDCSIKLGPHLRVLKIQNLDSSLKTYLISRSPCAEIMAIKRIDAMSLFIFIICFGWGFKSWVGISMVFGVSIYNRVEIFG